MCAEPNAIEDSEQILSESPEDKYDNLKDIFFNNDGLCFSSQNIKVQNIKEREDDYKCTK